MSQQFNFFAVDKDEEFVSETLVSLLGMVFCIPERGNQNEMIPQPVKMANDIRSQGIHDTICIFPHDFLHLVELREIPNNLYRIDFQKFPCIEYSPSIKISPGVIRVGRLVYFYKGDNKFNKDVKNLFRVLKKNAIKLKGQSGWWIFEHTAKTYKKLQFWVGPPKVNPMYKPVR